MALPHSSVAQRLARQQPAPQPPRVAAEPRRLGVMPARSLLVAPNRLLEQLGEVERGAVHDEVLGLAVLLVVAEAARPGAPGRRFGVAARERRLGVGGRRVAGER